MDLQLLRRLYQSSAAVDLALLSWLNRTSAVWVCTMVLLSVAGSGWSMIPIASLAAFGRTRALSLKVLAVLTTVAVTVYALKALIGRVRPCAAIPGIHGLVFSVPNDPSCPSGHAAGAFAFAVFLALETPLHLSIKIGVLLIAAGVGISRVALGVHFPTDVVAGAFVGTAVSLGASLVLSWRRRSRCVEGESHAS